MYLFRDMQQLQNPLGWISTPSWWLCVRTTELRGSAHVSLEICKGPHFDLLAHSGEHTTEDREVLGSKPR